ncbi:MAG: M20/M25/M40 family metallo-hydrolase [Acidobacteriota bacterium]
MNVIRHVSKLSILQLAVGLTCFTWLGVACSWNHRAPSSPEISQGELLNHLEYLASDELTGREAGTPGAEKAAAYIAREFRRYGLVPAGDEGGYLQRFSFVSGVGLGHKNGLQVIVRKPSPSSPPHPLTISGLRLGSDFMPTSFSRSGDFEGPAVFAGFGISAADLKHDDYQDIDVSGRFVLVLRYGPEGNTPHSRFTKYHALRYKALTAREKGAKGIVFIDDEEDFSKSSLSRLRFDQSYADSGIAAFAISRSLARRLFESAGSDFSSVEKAGRPPLRTALDGVSLKFTCELTKEQRQTANVIGMLPGTHPELKSEAIVIGAHYDHLGLGRNGSLASQPGRQIHNGADDNASGTAGVLELAQAFAGKHRNPHRTLIFVTFSAEEMGLLGSKHYVDHPPVPLEKTVAMINMDMIGRMKEKRLIVGGTGSSPHWKALLERANEPVRLELKFQDDAFGPSDHSSFYAKNIPVLFLFTGVHDDYHKPSDDYQKIRLETEQQILDLTYSIARELDLSDNRPQFARTAEPEPSGDRVGGFRVYLGTIPDYGEEVEGVKLSGVRAGSPAEKAGLQAGDIVVECAGKQIRNIYDYTYLLQEHEPGETVELTVNRSSQRVTLKVTLAGRN